MSTKNGRALPRFPGMASLSAREASFNHIWPSNRMQTPKELAQAGFFYFGTADHTVCFHCGGGLGCWMPHDNPWEEHARCYPECQFLINERGEQWIQEHGVTKTQPSSEPVLPDAETLRKERVCKVCLDAKCCIAFQPCGHTVCCVPCAEKIETCPICRFTVRSKELVLLV